MMTEVTERICGANGNAGAYYKSLPRGRDIMEASKRTPFFMRKKQTSKGHFYKTITDNDAEILKKAVRRYGLQKQLSKDCGLSVQTICHLCKRSAGSRKVLEKLTKHLKIFDKMECLK